MLRQQLVEDVGLVVEREADVPEDALLLLPRMKSHMPKSSNTLIRSPPQLCRR
jgi:hypothetical protein